ARDPARGDLHQVPVIVDQGLARARITADLKPCPDVVQTNRRHTAAFSCPYRRAARPLPSAGIVPPGPARDKGLACVSAAESIRIVEPAMLRRYYQHVTDRSRNPSPD